MTAPADDRIRQALARSFLAALPDTTLERPPAGGVAPVSQQAVADAVGLAREVVTRTVHDQRGAGLVDTARNGIRLLDPDGLSEVALSGEL